MLHCFEMENDQGEEDPGAAPEADPVLRPYTDIPQMTSKFAEIVPRPHLQGNSVPIAAIR